jgi:tetratricopeptide (TPR) repeat protein
MLLLAATVAFATSAGHWEAGKEAFSTGDYANALASFEAARDAGLDTPAAHYNIAVSQFRLGLYEQADRGFASLGQRFPAMRGLSEYNRGLVALRLGDRASARRHFLRAYDLSIDDATLRTLAVQRLRELEDDLPRVSRWQGAVGVRAGFDDNVALRDEAGLPAGTTTDSPMLDLFAVVQGPWDGRSGFRLDGSIYTVKYFDADDFDQSEVRGAVFYDWRGDDWRFQLGAHAGAGTLGGDSFDRKLGAHGRAVRYLGRNSLIDLRYNYDDVSAADSSFEGIEGSRQQLDLRYRWYLDDHRVQVRAWRETNSRADASVSPKRFRLGLDYGFRPTAGLGYAAGVDLRNSEYDQLEPRRDEDLLTIWGMLTYALEKDWLMSLEGRFADNDSSDEEFSYRRLQLTLGLLKTF